MNMLSEYICMHMYVILDLVSQILAFMKSYFPLLSSNDITSPKSVFTTIWYLWKVHSNIIFLIYNILLYWYLNQFIDCIIGHCSKRDFTFHDISFSYCFIGHFIAEPKYSFHNILPVVNIFLYLVRLFCYFSRFKKMFKIVVQRNYIWSKPKTKDLN